MVNVHASGGPRMLEAARSAIDDVARGGTTRLIGVTVLTSFDAASSRPSASRLSGLAGRSAGRSDTCRWPRRGPCARHRKSGRFAPGQAAGFPHVTPGIRPAQSLAPGSSGDSVDRPNTDQTMVADDDQRRTLTPAEAIDAGSDYLVIGRPHHARPGSAGRTRSDSCRSAGIQLRTGRGCGQGRIGGLACVGEDLKRPPIIHLPGADAA